MRQSSITCGLVALTLLAPACADSQTELAPKPPVYHLTVPANEVILTFHAADAQGFPDRDLKLTDLSLLDNDKPPRSILAFHLLQDAPIRAAILMDTSVSMQPHLARNRSIAIQYAQQLLYQQTDQAIVMSFGRVTNMLQPWTDSVPVLTAAIGRIGPDSEGLGAGTAIFDALHYACFHQFGQLNPDRSSNFILLFSDGEDNASYVSLQNAIEMCQRNNTAIYAFRTETKSGFDSTGPSTLTELARESGGRVFPANGSADEIAADLRLIESDLRDQYWLVYRPAQLKRDGSFHRIELNTPRRFDTIVTRSGYYAPAH